MSEIVKTLLHLYAASGVSLSPDQIGIITPFRAQVAMIKNELSKLNISVDLMTVDTVERFQGGARDIIIISLCVNSANQLENLISLSSDGVDRKLNVALTRARQQLILLGDPQILQGDQTYQSLINEYQVKY